MATDAEIKSKFWAALKDDMTMFLGVAGGEDGHARPMTAQLENDESGPIWFFAGADNDMVKMLGGAAGVGGGASNRAMAHFVSKGHDLWATLYGSLSVTSDQATIDRLWNPHVGAWFEGKNDPNIRLIRLDPEEAQIWIDASSMVAGIKMMLGIDPKKDYEDKVATVALS